MTKAKLRSEVQSDQIQDTITKDQIKERRASECIVPDPNAKVPTFKFKRNKVKKEIEQLVRP